MLFKNKKISVKRELCYNKCQTIPFKKTINNKCFYVCEGKKIKKKNKNIKTIHPLVFGKSLQRKSFFKTCASSKINIKRWLSSF